MKRISHKRIYLTASASMRKVRRDNRARRRVSIKKQLIRFRNRIEKKKSKRTTLEVIDLVVKGNLTIFKKSHGVIQLINSLEYHNRKTKKIKFIRINLRNINEIDIGAVSFLLAKINEMSTHKRIQILCILPENEECKNFIEKSGFLDHMKDLLGRKFRKNSDNFIIRVGKNKTRNHQVGNEIKKAMKFISEKEQHFPPVFSIVQEMCSNSVEWANFESGENKNWFFGIHFIEEDNTKYLQFTLTDVGSGILKTLHKRWRNKIEDFFLNDNKTILEKAFEKKYGSKSGEVNRNKGLPLIKDRFQNKLINNLIVITNDVFLDFCNPQNSCVMKDSIQGTFYSWKLKNENIQHWKRKKQYLS